MRKILSTLLLLVITAASFAQADSSLQMILKDNQISQFQLNGKTYYSLEEPTAKSLQQSFTNLTETVKAQKVVIDSLKALTLNQGIQISNLQQQLNAGEILVNAPSLIIGNEHNGKTIKINSQCIVTFPAGLNIKCSIIRTAKPTVTISGSILTNLNYRSISGYPGKIDVDYTGGTALITGNLTK